MSAFTFLFYTGLIYVSLADPIPPSKEVKPDVTNIQAQGEAMFKAVKEVIETHISPLLNKVDQSEQDYIKNQCNRIARGSINYMMYWLNDETNPKSASVDDNAFILQFDAPDWPSIPGTQENECML